MDSRGHNHENVEGAYRPSRSNRVRGKRISNARARRGSVYAPRTHPEKSSGLIEAQGTLDYSRQGRDYRLVLNVGKGIQAFYKSLIPKTLSFQESMHRPHVTVVRPKRDKPEDLSKWGKYQGYKVWYSYDPFIRYNYLYAWLNVWSVSLHEIRTELGLKPWQTWRVPPDGKGIDHYGECFHITLGNNKQEEKPFPYTLLPVRDYERKP